MKNKFWFLTKQSLKNKINTKAFKIINVFMCIILVCLINLKSIIKFFGGDFDDLVNIYVVDEANMYKELEKNMDSNLFNVFDSYNAKVSISERSLDELEKEIEEKETEDIILHITDVDEKNLTNIFNVEIISYEYIDNILYEQIVNSLNECKRKIALEIANVDEKILSDIDKPIEVNRILLNKDLNSNDELLELIGAVLIIIFILPIFMLIITVVQMIGAEINEEKTSKSMEIIISSVSPQTHFLSKIISSNLFAIIQAILLAVYGLIGMGIKIATTGPISLDNGKIAEFVSVIAEEETSNESILEVTNFLTESNIIGKITNAIPLFIILIILTVVAYTLLIGVLASITTSMEDFQQMQSPVMIFLMAGYFLAIYSAVFRGSLFLEIASFIPFISGILSPVLYILGEISLYELIISILILVGTILLLYKYGIKIYKVGILNYSSSNLWKKVFKALKD